MADPATRPYRIEIPNLVDDLDLSVYAFRLYGHIKRVAGPSGTCYEGARRLAEKCRMSPSKVAEAKQELLDKGLITRGKRHTNGGETDELTPVDLWAQNFQAFSKGDRCAITMPEGDRNAVIARRSPANMALQRHKPPICLTKVIAKVIAQRSKVIAQRSKE